MIGKQHIDFAQVDIHCWRCSNCLTGCGDTLTEAVSELLKLVKQEDWEEVDGKALCQDCIKERI
jgi:hypothetical protein